MRLNLLGQHVQVRVGEQVVPGVIVRYDRSAPNRVWFALTDGRLLDSSECQYELTTTTRKLYSKARLLTWLDEFHNQAFHRCG